jgi:DNA-binding NarL/FixJ family response regulator
LERVKDHHLGLAIVDLSLNGEDGLALIADLHQRRIPVLVYYMHNDAPHVQSAFAAGALGYVTKLELDRVLMEAIRDVAAGRRFVSPEAAIALAQDLTPPSDAFTRLSVQEREVYEMLGRGESTAEIATAMQVSNRTVESYCERILVKLSLNGMHELRRHAIEHLQKHSR